MARKIARNFQQLVTSYNSGQRGCLLEGGSRCFDGDQVVFLSKDNKPIKYILPGEPIISYNEATKKYEADTVKAVNIMPNEKKCYEVTLKNGEKIRATYDHRFYINGKWMTLEQIKTEYEKRKMEKNSRV